MNAVFFYSPQKGIVVKLRMLLTYVFFLKTSNTTNIPVFTATQKKRNNALVKGLHMFHIYLNYFLNDIQHPNIK